MKVIGLIGSPRKGGSSNILTDEVLRGAQEAGAEIEKVYLDDLKIRPIGDVGEVSCNQRIDIRNDDDFPELLERFLDADVAVLATPLYWFGVSAQMKCFIDRLSSYFRVPPYASRFDGKGYVVLCTWGRNEPDLGKWITEPMKICVDTLRGKYLGDICVSVPSHKKSEIRQNTKVLQKAYELGRSIGEHCQR